MVFATRETGQCLAIHTTYISQFAATFNEARNQAAREQHRHFRPCAMLHFYDSGAEALFLFF
jgi:hypothetical protein